MELKDYLLKNDISVLEFAEEVGISFSAIYRFMKGKGRPTRENAYKIEKETRGAVTAKELRTIKPKTDNG